jgi:hypothetical protein
MLEKNTEENCTTAVVEEQISVARERMANFGEHFSF